MKKEYRTYTKLLETELNSFKKSNNSLNSLSRFTNKDILNKQNTENEQSSSNLNQINNLESLSKIRNLKETLINKSSQQTPSNSNNNNKNINSIKQPSSESQITIYPKYLDLKEHEIKYIIEQLYLESTVNSNFTSLKFKKLIFSEFRISLLSEIDLEIIFNKCSNKKGYLDLVSFLTALEEIAIYVFNKPTLIENMQKFISIYLSNSSSLKTIIDRKMLIENMIKNKEFEELVKNNRILLWSIYLHFFPIIDTKSSSSSNNKDTKVISLLQEKEFKLCFLEFCSKIKIMPLLLANNKCLEVFNKTVSDYFNHEDVVNKFYLSLFSNNMNMNISNVNANKSNSSLSEVINNDLILKTNSKYHSNSKGDIELNNHSNNNNNNYSFNTNNNNNVIEKDLNIIRNAQLNDSRVIKQRESLIHNTNNNNISKNNNNMNVINQSLSDNNNKNLSHYSLKELKNHYNDYSEFIKLVSVVNNHMKLNFFGFINCLFYISVYSQEPLMCVFDYIINYFRQLSNTQEHINKVLKIKQQFFNMGLPGSKIIISPFSSKNFNEGEISNIEFSSKIGNYYNNINNSNNINNIYNDDINNIINNNEDDINNIYNINYLISLIDNNSYSTNTKSRPKKRNSNNSVSKFNNNNNTNSNINNNKNKSSNTLYSMNTNNNINNNSNIDLISNINNIYNNVNFTTSVNNKRSSHMPNNRNKETNSDILFTIYKYYCSLNNSLDTSCGVDLSRQSFSILIKDFKLTEVFVGSSLSDFIECFNTFSNNIDSNLNKSSNHITYTEFILIIIGLSYLKYSKFNHLSNSNSNISNSIIKNTKNKSSLITIINLHSKIKEIISMEKNFPSIIDQCVSTLVKKHLKIINYRTIKDLVKTSKKESLKISERINELISLDRNFNFFSSSISMILEKIFIKYSVKTVTVSMSKSNTDNLNSDNPISKDHYISFTKFYSFCLDFRLFPDLMLSKRDIYFYFSSLVFNLDEFIKYSNKDFYLNYDNFLYCLFIIAFKAPLTVLNGSFYNKWFMLLDKMSLRGFEINQIMNLKNELNNVLNNYRVSLESGYLHTNGDNGEYNNNDKRDNEGYYRSPKNDRFCSNLNYSPGNYIKNCKYDVRDVMKSDYHGNLVIKGQNDYEKQQDFKNKSKRKISRVKIAIK